MGAEWRGDHASHDERSGNGMSSGPRLESGVGAWDGRRAEHSRRASGLLELLLRLLREQYTWTGALIIESLKKIKPKGDDLPQKLAGKSGWSGLPHAQGIELLEAALAQALHDPEWRLDLKEQ